MKGIQHIEVSNRLAKFKFDLVRNITYTKSKLPAYYLQKENAEKVMSEITP